MVRLVLYVLILFQVIVRCSADLPCIVLTVRNISYVEPVPRLIVNEPFIIKVYSSKKVIGIRCYSGDYQAIYFDFDLFHYHGLNYEYYAPKNKIIATEAMNGTWRCTIDRQLYGGIPATINFKVDVGKTGTGSTESGPKSVIAEPAPPDDPKYLWRVPTSTATLYYFDVMLYRNGEKIVNKVNSMIGCNKTFTVSVYLSPQVIPSVEQKYIRCNNISRSNEVYFNQPLYQNTSSPGIYTAEVPAIPTEIAPNWSCEIYWFSAKFKSKISFTCSVYMIYIMPSSPAHLKPQPAKPGNGNISVTPHPPPPSNPAKPGNGNISVTPHPPPPSNPENPRSSILIISGAAVAIVVVIALAIFGLIGYRKARARKADAGAADGNGPVYESVDYMACGKLGTEATASIDIASRPPCPLPPQEDEGNEKYVHYDTVYEERLQRMVMMYRLRRQARKPCSQHVGRTCAQ